MMNLLTHRNPMVKHQYGKNFKTESVGRYAFSFKLLWRITESNR
jgi:hypothetical protein